MIKLEQYDRVGILDEPRVGNDEADRYPSLKWGLVALMTGIGFIVIEVLGLFNREMIHGRDAVLPLGNFNGISFVRLLIVLLYCE